MTTCRTFMSDPQVCCTAAVLGLHMAWWTCWWALGSSVSPGQYRAACCLPGCTFFTCAVPACLQKASGEVRAAELRAADAAAEVQRQQDIVAVRESELRRLQQVQSPQYVVCVEMPWQPTYPRSWSSCFGVVDQCSGLPRLTAQSSRPVLSIILVSASMHLSQTQISSLAAAPQSLAAPWPRRVISTPPPLMISRVGIAWGFRPAGARYCSCRVSWIYRQGRVQGNLFTVYIVMAGLAVSLLGRNGAGSVGRHTFPSPAVAGPACGRLGAGLPLGQTGQGPRQSCRATGQLKLVALLKARQMEFFQLCSLQAAV